MPGLRDLLDEPPCRISRATSPLFVTLNPPRPPRAGTLLHSEFYEHPIFDASRAGRAATALVAAGQAQHLVLRRLFRLGLPRGRIAGGAGRCRATRRRPAALGRAERIRAHRARTRGRCETHGRRSDGMTRFHALYVGSVMHRRLRPRVHRFRYRAFWLLLDLDELDELGKRLRWFSHNRLNLFSLLRRRPWRRQRHAASRPGRAAAARGRIDLAGGRIQLLCMPRTLGYCFNPLSVVLFLRIARMARSRR